MKVIVLCLFCVIIFVKSDDNVNGTQPVDRQPSEFRPGGDEYRNVTYQPPAQRPVFGFKNGTYEYFNVTYQPVERQLLDFKLEHPHPIGLWTTVAGDPVDIRDTLTINSDLFSNQMFIDTISTFNGRRIPERIATAKGTGAFGYFEVTNDVTKYTYADVFNGVGKKTPIITRFATALQNIGGSDLRREIKTMATKFYTKEGNLDLLCISTPVFPFRDPMLFRDLVNAFQRNPQTDLYDFTAVYDLTTQKPETIHNLFWIMSDYGLPNGYRRMDSFAIHAFELSNKYGEKHYVRFNFRAELGFSPLFTPQAAAIQAIDLDYYTRDLYNAIDRGEFAAWKLEMDVMTKHDLQKVDYDPFDTTKLWKNGTFITVPIGRLVLNRNPDSHFRDIEQAAFNPGHLVPGIPGPVDTLFLGRRAFYRDTQNYRLGRNHNNILVNKPLYEKTYARDGRPPTNLNMKNAPNYYPNSFNGPVPYVDEKRPLERLQVLENNAVDLEPAWYFYNFILEDEAHRQRFIDNVVVSLLPVTPPVIQKVFKFFFLIDQELGTRVKAEYEVALAAQQAAALAAPPPMAPSRSVPSSRAQIKYDTK